MLIDRKVSALPAIAVPAPSPAQSDTVVLDPSTKNEDIERTSESASVLPLDPFHLRDAIKSEKQLLELREHKKLQNYYARQNNLIVSLLKSMDEHTSEARDEEDAARLPVKIAIWASLIANLILCVLQMYAAISALSLSLLATGIDSVFDIGSNVLLLWLNRKAESLDVKKWPVGGARLETIGNIIYDFGDRRLSKTDRMSSVNLVVIVESVRDLVTHTNGSVKNFHLPSILAVASALFVKFALFLYCFSLRKNSSQVHVLWEDHRNDLWINGFGILMSTGGSKLRWFLDPMGAVIIALGVIMAWGKTIYGQFELLAGKSAPHDVLKLLTYKSLTFSEEIERIDTVRAYHDFFVEVDIVMDPKTPLWKAHDISEHLQSKIEALPQIERAFVHVDYETSHQPEHRKT
ncbi:CDF-like metal transporter [Lentinula lateritia]|uniref:CDF-like metal transporter n=1 Tax=Lentinula aff. lateritia TaxID=2804960 RepID=A0ACC1UF35_9AGAR|nr:CDF-like metal transporter [Lentinula aff. lateritia]KAJ3856784.1 CDF-like metal transporter [Lentinula lateritia]